MKSISVGGLSVFQDVVSETLRYLARDLDLPLDGGLSLVRTGDGCRVEIGGQGGFALGYSPILLTDGVKFYEHIRRSICDYLSGLTAGAGI